MADSRLPPLFLSRLMFTDAANLSSSLSLMDLVLSHVRRMMADHGGAEPAVDDRSVAALVAHVENLPHSVLSAGLECPVCMDGTDATLPAVTLGCCGNSTFHTRCLVTWVTAHKDTCPCCRAVIRPPEPPPPAPVAVLAGGDADPELLPLLAASEVVDRAELRRQRDNARRRQQRAERGAVPIHRLDDLSPADRRARCNAQSAASHRRRRLRQRVAAGLPPLATRVALSPESRRRRRIEQYSARRNLLRSPQQLLLAVNAPLE
jgi:hypothetical protein